MLTRQGEETVSQISTIIPYTVQILNEVRRHFIEKYPEFFFISEDEESRGWHFCPEFDYKLVGPGLEEMDMCECFAKIRGLRESEL
jgi:hypothetical protein